MRGDERLNIGSCNEPSGHPQRCVLITNGNLPSMLALADWITQHGDKLAKVYVTYRLPSSKSNLRGVADLLISSGVAYTFLKIWINRIAPLQLRRRGVPASVADFIRHRGLKVPVEPVDSVRTPAIIEEIRSLEPDILVSFSATQRFNEPLIAAPRIGAINVHYGALPRYAGLSPYYWHLHNGERQFGVTLHRIEPQLDAGGIIEQVIDDIGTTQTCLDLLLRMADQVSPLLNRFFEGCVGLDDARPQDLSERSYFRHPDRRQVRAFHARGLRMMDRESRNRLFRKVACLSGKG